MTSGRTPHVQLGSTEPTEQLLCASSAAPRNPFIKPRAVSLIAALSECGPPPLIGLESWYGRTQLCRAGSGTHGTGPGLPAKPGIPSAPGYVPKYESKLRFSCMI